MVTWKSAYDVNEIHCVLDVLKTSPYLLIHLQKNPIKQKMSMFMHCRTEKYIVIPYHTYNLD